MTESTQTQRITMYGADWCSDCRRSKSLLTVLGVDYDFVDVAESAEAAAKSYALSGRTNIPVIVFPDATLQVEPSDALLHAKLLEVGAISASS